MAKLKIPEPTIFSNSRQFLSLVISLKYFYIISVVALVTIAFLINRYSIKEYKVFASISPVKNETSSLLSSNELFRGLQSLETYNNIENEVNNLSSFTMISSTISKLNLELGYFSEKRTLFKETNEIYNKSPFSVSIDKSHVQPINGQFYISILDDTKFRLSFVNDDVSLYNYIDNQIVSEHVSLKIDTICRFNETIHNTNFKFSVSYNKNINLHNNTNGVNYYFEFYNLDLLAKEYLKKLVVARVSPSSSILNVQFNGNNIDKVIIFLNSYLNNYFDESLSKKNKVAVNTIKFIDSQISEISDSLILSESKLKTYRSANQVMNLSYQGQMTYDRLQKVDADRQALKIKERYYNYIIDYLKTNKDVSGLAPPSAMNVDDPIMNKLIGELLTLNSDRSNILNNKSEKNLFLGQIENKINVQKQAIIENVTNNLNTLSLTINELNYAADKLSNEISNLPKTELNMVSMQRKFNLNDAIYTYLLQKKSEAYISMASNYPDYEILEPARAITSQIVAPKTLFNYMVSLFFGLLIPTLYIIIKDFFNTKIQSAQYIEHLVNRSVLGSIYSNDKKSESVLIDYPISSVSESFRNLRSNLFLKLKSPASKVLLLTSSQPRDGKSFISYNLSIAIASVGYKTVIIDADLRRPTIHAKFKLDNEIGLSNYMTHNASADKIITSTSVENLSLIPAGPVLPNPLELIETGVLDNLIESLKSKYEYIIIDTTPVGIVADATMLMKYASHILVVARNNYTRKDVFSNVLDSLELHNITNFDVVFNDLNLKESPYKKYSTYYIKEKNS